MRIDVQSGERWRRASLSGRGVREFPALAMEAASARPIVASTALARISRRSSYVTSGGKATGTPSKLW